MSKTAEPEASKTWYHFTHEVCPICSAESVHRERRVGPKPKAHGERHVYTDYAFCNCDGRHSM